jgi:hypothetical protein
MSQVVSSDIFASKEAKARAEETSLTPELLAQYGSEWRTSTKGKFRLGDINLILYYMGIPVPPPKHPPMEFPPDFVHDCWASPAARAAAAEHGLIEEDFAEHEISGHTGLITFLDIKDIIRWRNILRRRFAQVVARAAIAKYGLTEDNN